MTYMAEERWHDCQLVHYTQLWSLSPATTCISSTSAWVTPITRNILITHKNSSVHFQCRSGTSPYSDNSSMAPVSVWEHCMNGQQCHAKILTASPLGEWKRPSGCPWITWISSPTTAHCLKQWTQLRISHYRGCWLQVALCTANGAS